MLDAAPKTSKAQLLGRILLGLMLVSSGVSHRTYLRAQFQAQVPPWVPLSPDLVVVLSGCVEIILGLSFIALYRRKVYVGITAALFFVAVFPGNIAQYTEHRAAFGLDTDTARLVRLGSSEQLWPTEAIPLAKRFHILRATKLPFVGTSQTAGRSR
jgi:uncharacterized membrane protein